MRQGAEIRGWSENLRRIAVARLSRERVSDEIGRGFADERGHRRRVDGPFLRHLRAATGMPELVPVVARALPDEDQTRDVELWNCVATGRPAPAWLDARSVPLVSGVQPASIEVFTEMELCSLHALWWIDSRERGSRGSHIDALVRWHVEHLQPDNATGHPWAIHVFVLHAIDRECPEARLHAEGLLHASLVEAAEPDRLSALVLLDASEALNLASGGG